MAYIIKETFEGKSLLACHYIYYFDLFALQKNNEAAIRTYDIRFVTDIFST